MPVTKSRKTRRQPLNLKTTDELREKIEQAASENGWSMTREIEKRLESTFGQDDIAARLDRIERLLTDRLLPRDGGTVLDAYSAFDQSARASLERFEDGMRPLVRPLWKDGP